MKKPLIIIALACLAGLNSSAQQSYSLEEAIDFATKNNASVKNAVLGIESANQKVKETRAIGLPQVSAAGEFQNFLDIPITVAPANAFNPAAPADELVSLQFGTEFNAKGSLNANQLIFNGSYLVGLQTSKKFKKVSEFQKTKTIQDVKENVIKAYYGALVAEKTMVTLTEIAATAQTIYDQTKGLFDQGLIEEDNVTQLSLNVLQAKNSLNGAKRQWDNTKNLLKFQMGMDVNESISLTSDFDAVISSLDASQSEVTSEINQNIDFLLLNQQRELNVLNVKYEQSQYLPSLNAFFTHQQNALRNDFDLLESGQPWFPTTIWGLNLSVPIFSSGSRSSKVSQAKIQLKQTENSLSQLEKGLSIQTLSAKTNYDNAFDTYTTSKEAVAISKKIYNNYQIKFKEGLITSLDLSQIQTQYLSTQTQYIQAMYNLVSAKIELDKITNKL
ncbi:MAG: TolC family protein [Flavobacteriales bacterium]